VARKLDSYKGLVVQVKAKGVFAPGESWGESMVEIFAESETAKLELS
jgi:hypothetical protein